MKWQAIWLVLWAISGLAQQGQVVLHDHSETAAVLGFTYNTSYKDVNCAGFISRDRIGVGRTIQGGTSSPESDHFTAKNTVFLAGSGYEVGERYAVVRDIRNPNRDDYLSRNNKQMNQLGHLYAELGHVRIDRIENGYAIATVEASCQPIAAGDVLIPFHDKGSFTALPRTTPFQVFGVALPRRYGTIVMASEFDTSLGCIRSSTSILAPELG